MKINSQLSGFLNNLETLEIKTNEIDTFIVRDYKALPKKIDKNIKNEYLENYKLKENEYFENASHNVYYDKDLWDLIAIINDRNVLTDRVFSSDVTNEIAEKLTNNYFYNFDCPYQGNATNELREEYKNYLLDKLNTKNLKNAIIKIIKPEYLAEYLRNTKYK